MAAPGRVYKRCGCVDPATGRRYGTRCPRLTRPGHGSWYITFDLPPGPDGLRRRLRHGGYRTRVLAERALADLRRPTAADPTRQLLTTGQWLEYWLATRLRPRPSTLRGYASHVRRDITPHIGRILLRELSLDDVQLLFAILARTPTRRGRARAASSLHRIRATLRVALNAAVRRGLIETNPARFVELPPADRPKAVVWTEPRVALWRATGEHPVVSVWTAAQTAKFLDSVHDHRLYLLFRLIALVGLRRGEACGLRWCDVDLDRRMLIISHQLQHRDTGLVLCPPKTRHSARLVALDRSTTALLRRYRTAQRAEGRAWGGFVFTNARGGPVAPDQLSRLFVLLSRRAGLPPVRLHDLRHGAATLSLAAGNDLKVVQAMLGHASIVLTADTYASVLPALAYQAADATARLVLRDQSRTTRGFQQRARNRARTRPATRTVRAAVPVGHADMAGLTSDSHEIAAAPRRSR